MDRVLVLQTRGLSFLLLFEFSVKCFSPTLDCSGFDISKEQMEVQEEVRKSYTQVGG